MVRSTKVKRTKKQTNKEKNPNPQEFSFKKHFIKNTKKNTSHSVPQSHLLQMFVAHLVATISSSLGPLGITSL